MSSQHDDKKPWGERRLTHSDKLRPPLLQEMEFPINAKAKAKSRELISASFHEKAKTRQQISFVSDNRREASRKFRANKCQYPQREKSIVID
jgi:hypothetical protein